MMQRAGRRWLAGLVLSLAMLGGCASSFQPMGAALREPRVEEGAIVTADGYRLPLRVWRPEQGRAVRSVILALHGYNDYSNAFDGAGRAFAAAGIVTYAYDQRGFGATRDPGIWPGTDALVADLDAALALVRRRHPGLPVHVLGESMGGAVVLTALTRPHPPPVDGAILVAPAVWGFDAMGFLPRAALWLTYNTVPGMVVYAPKELGIKPSDNIEMLRAMGRDPLVIKGSRVDALWGLTMLMNDALAATERLRVPALVLYGAHEQVLPPEPVERAMESLATAPAKGTGAVRIAVYPDGYHMLLRDLAGGIVLNDIVHWLAEPAAALPSGADRQPRQLLANRPTG